MNRQLDSCPPEYDQTLYGSRGKYSSSTEFSQKDHKLTVQLTTLFQIQGLNKRNIYPFHQAIIRDMFFSDQLIGKSLVYRLEILQFASVAVGKCAQKIFNRGKVYAVRYSTIPSYAPA
jgi:hypothetical protein